MAFKAGTATERPQDFKVGQRVESFAGMLGTVEHVSIAPRGTSRGLNFVRVQWDNGHVGRLSTHVGNLRIVG